ncbi:hypothetical protein O181_033424 [Austropuccinia psidii MF-1]|uniref:RNA-directed DNA polymerase n=1 Tax=Austropuccinia psidii MF-1 TaxID=1389203 RepID=A0A9Q3CYR1_9BASI|nr:hypothetical protein [Austropuccinia psidii MF-1]
MSELPGNISLFILDSNESPALFITHYTKWVVEFPSFPIFEWDFFIIDSPRGEDLILGYDFLYHFNPIIDWKNGLITYDSSHKDSSGIKSSASNSLATAVNSVALVGELKTPSLPSCHLSHYLNKYMREYGPSSLEEQWDEEEEPEEIKTVFKVVPPAYHQYLNVFSNMKAGKPAPHCTCDHHIELEGILPPVGVIYSLLNKESETLQAYISENVEKGFIRPRSSSTGAPVLFVKKKDGGLHLCVDYRKLNYVTRKKKYPFSSMNQLLTVFNSATIFSKIDLCGAYNLLRVKEGDEHLTAFRTKYGSYKYLVMPFGLTNAPASFQNLVNDIFADFMDILVVVYFDDIMVFSSSEEEHVKHVALKMDSSKVQQILNWPQPKSIKALQYFLGFSNSCCYFIKNYSKKITSLTSLLKKDSPFIFNEDALSQFQILKEAFTTAPILSHFNPSLPTIVETNASDYALGSVLSQVNESGKHPISFDSCKLLPADLNYEIHNKELIGIVWALKHWRAFLLSLSNPFEVLTDHSFLQYFMSSKVLTRCQAHWAEFLSEFHFTITYRPGRLATLPDAFSCQDNVNPERGVDFISKNPQNFHQVIKQDGIQDSRFFSIKVEIFSHLVDQIQKEVRQGKDYKEIIKQSTRGESVSDYSL